MKRLSLLILFTAALIFSASAQTGFLKSKDAWLGQKPPGDTPQVFAEQLLMKKDTFPMGRVASRRMARSFITAAAIPGITTALQKSGILNMRTVNGTAPLC